LTRQQFGKQIQQQALPEWADHYLNYKALKKVIKAQEARQAARKRSDGPATDEQPSFLEHVDREVEKVGPLLCKRGSSEGTRAVHLTRPPMSVSCARRTQVEAFYSQRETELKARLASLTVR